MQTDLSLCQQLNYLNFLGYTLTNARYITLPAMEQAKMLNKVLDIDTDLSHCQQ